MSKVTKVDHVVLTLALTPAAQQSGGLSKKEIDNMVNVRLAEGFDDFESHFIRTNYDDRQQATHTVVLYIFKKYEEPAKSKKEKDAA